MVSHVVRGGRALTIVIALGCLAALLATVNGYLLSASPAGMTPPPGYSLRQLIFQDRFSGTRLDTSKWVSYLGAAGERWDNFDSLPEPYSGLNTPTTTEEAMFGPSGVSVHNGLTLKATRNTNPYSGTYPWLSGVISTEGKFSLPTSGWYVQVKAKMPDTTQGMWPAIWFLRGPAGSPDNEIDLFEGGATGGSHPQNQEGHTNFFADQGTIGSLWNAGVNLSTGYHIYGMQFIPGKSITAYLDGKQVWRVQASSDVTITGEPYEIILQLQVAAPQASQFHTVTTPATGPATMHVAEVQAYS